VPAVVVTIACAWQSAETYTYAALTPIVPFIRPNANILLTEGDRQAGNDEDLAGHGQLVRQTAGYIWNVECY
jgi:hypothetical protein